MFSNTQVFTFDIDFNYILALWTSTNWSMLFLGLIFQHSNTPSYIYLDIGLLKHPQHHFTFIPVALNSELHYYNHLNAPLCNHPWVASPRLVSSLSTGPGCGVSYWLCPDSSSTVSPSGWPILCILLSVHGSSWPILCIPA
jgi:hypothetical protein